MSSSVSTGRRSTTRTPWSPGRATGWPAGPPSSPASTWSGRSSTPTTRRSRAGTVVIVHGYDLGVAHHGGFATLARVPAGWVVPLPEGLTPRQAATIGTAGFTAALSVSRLEHLGLRPGTGPVVVTGASGGVGSMAVALAGRAGLRGGGQHRPHQRGRLPAGTGGERGHRARRAHPGTRAHPRSRAVGRCRGLRGRAHPRRRPPLPALRRGGGGQRPHRGDRLETSVFPFIVRNVSLLGIDTVQTPIDERRAVWQSLAGAFPDTAARGHGGRRGRPRRRLRLARVHPGRAGAGPGAGSAGGLTGRAQPAGAVDWLPGPPEANTGETTTVPPPHGAKVAVTTRWSVALGGVTSIDEAVGHDDSPPVGTSE